MKRRDKRIACRVVCRSLHWERGLKHQCLLHVGALYQSLPSLGAWIETRRCWAAAKLPSRRSLHWERGLKLLREGEQGGQGRRSLHWERGLKPPREYAGDRAGMSLPSLGAWIETRHASCATSTNCRRSLHWECGLKLGGARAQPRARGRSLHWERGLKRPREYAGDRAGMSLPSLGAWIETCRRTGLGLRRRSLPSLGAWIETSLARRAYS